MHNLHKWVVGLARLVAVIGGAVLLTLILITCISILGRAVNTMLHSDVLMAFAPGLAQGLIDLGIGAIPGDFELVESGMAFCIFAFLPFCHVTAGHATVDIFTNSLPLVARRWLLFATELLFAAALVIIAMQLEVGLERKMRSGQTTLLLQFPLWWSYMASFCAACLAAAAGVYMALVRLFEAVSGDTVVPAGMGADH